MNTFTATNHGGLLLVQQEKINSEELLKAASGALSVIVLLYNPSEQKLQYNIEQLLIVLGYEDSMVHSDTFGMYNILHSEDTLVFNAWLQQLNKGETRNEPLQLRMLNGIGEYVPFYITIAGKDLSGSYLITVFNKPFVLAAEQVKGTIRKTIDELQHSNRELEDFAYVASHDLQEPLRKISTFSNLLVNRYGDALEGDAKMYLSRIAAGAENMRMFIDNLLDFSRVTRVKEQFAPTDLNFIMQQVLADLELTIGETCTHVNAERLPVVNVSASQMKQLFNNIINNAIKFRKPRTNCEINITTRLLSADEILTLGLLQNKNYYRISITDNGIGFEPEYAGRIFQVFQRLHGKSEYPGSGIGLAICKKITEFHKGYIYAEQKDGGACFHVILPADIPVLN
jgi:signal transduction histidine kinase